jgi:hypothetical protein
MNAYNDSQRAPWRNAMNVCFKGKRFPTSVDELNLLNEQPFFEPSWAGVVKSDVIYSFKVKFKFFQTV